LYIFSNVMSWHMFAYYGTTALLIAYIVTQLHFTDAKGYAVFGTFSALAWGLPLFGGVIADKILGRRKSLIWGMLLQFIGLSCVASPGTVLLFIGLSFFVVGNGFIGGVYKALAGDFYRQEEAREKDAGFTILYGLFNVGVALGSIVCGYVGQEINWHLGFGIAALGAFITLMCMVFGINKSYGLPPVKAGEKIIPGLNFEFFTYLLCFPVIALTTLIFSHPGVMDVVLFPLATVAFGYIIYLSFRFSKTERLKMFAAMMVFVVYIMFLALYEQTGGSFNLFVIRNMDMHVGSILLPGLAINNFLTGFLPAIMMPLMLFVWRKLGQAGREPGTIMKFVIGMLFMGAFFASFWWGCRLYSGTGMVPVYFLFFGYILIEFSELCIGPILFSVSHKLSPGQIAGTMMGVLGIAAALGEYLAAKIGGLMVVPSNIHDPVKTLPYYTHIFGDLALLSFGCAAVLALLLPAFKRLMQDVV